MKRMTESMKAVASHPWFAWLVLAGRIVLGGFVIGFAAVMWYKDPTQWKVWAGVALFGFAILPGILPFVAANLRPLLTLWKSSRKANGTGGPPSAPSGGNA